MISIGRMDRAELDETHRRLFAEFPVSHGFRTVEDHLELRRLRGDRANHRLRHAGLVHVPELRGERAISHGQKHAPQLLHHRLNRPRRQRVRKIVRMEIDDAIHG